MKKGKDPHCKMKNEPIQTIQIISSIREFANKSLNTFIMFHTQDIFEAWLKKSRQRKLFIQLNTLLVWWSVFGVQFYESIGKKKAIHPIHTKE